MYLSFKEIEGREFREIVRYYEDHLFQIKQLEFEEYFELQVAYLNALFEIGAYRKYLDLVEKSIEATILHNIKYHKGEDIFQKLLFKKAASFYHLMEYKRSEHVLRELVKMNPHDEAVILLLKKTLRKSKVNLVKRTRAVSIFLFLLTAVVICVELLFVRNFIAQYTPQAELLRNGIFALGCLILMSGDLINYWKVSHLVNIYVEAARERKSHK
ncbi:MAG: hypothetical protein AAFO94_17865 [Bacteroidota bacterium]